VGELIVLAERLADRSRPAATGQLAFFFDLACPFSYLAAERIERALGHVEWIPTAAVNVQPARPWSDSPSVRHEAERQAAAFRLPLVWPDHARSEAPSALRAASYAVELGAGAQFALAASRLAFCGGFDLEDPEILAEAAAAAGIPLAECLEAAGDVSRDGALHATGRGLRSRGVQRLPAIKLERTWFSGETAVVAAAAALRARQVLGSPLAPAG
jgi:2-hydroxychromene-2-carboxylate isomerase